MSEVSCHVFDVLKRPLEVKGIPFDGIVKDTGVSIARLRDKKGRMTWTEFVAIMKNIRPHFTDDEYVVIGHSHMSTPGLRFAAVVARLAMTPIDLYRWYNQPRKGVGNQLFTCIVPRYQEVSANRIDLESNSQSCQRCRQCDRAARRSVAQRARRSETGSGSFGSDVGVRRAAECF